MNIGEAIRRGLVPQSIDRSELEKKFCNSCWIRAQDARVRTIEPTVQAIDKARAIDQAWATDNEWTDKHRTTLNQELALAQDKDLAEVQRRLKNPAPPIPASFRENPFFYLLATYQTEFSAGAMNTARSLHKCAATANLDSVRDFWCTATCVAGSGTE